MLGTISKAKKKIEHPKVWLTTGTSAPLNFLSMVLTIGPTAIKAVQLFNYCWQSHINI